MSNCANEVSKCDALTELLYVRIDLNYKLFLLPLQFFLCNFFSLIFLYYIFFHAKIPMTSAMGFKTNLPSGFFSLNKRKKNLVLI
jgi:hypothetical protein